MVWTPPHLISIKVPDWKRYSPVNDKKESTMEVKRVGIDLAKNVFQLHGVDRHEQAVFKRRLKRDQWLRVLLDNTDPDCARQGGLQWCASLGA
jgi:hypothetical protein